jgi:hypothetical protein
MVFREFRKWNARVEHIESMSQGVEEDIDIEEEKCHKTAK